MTMKMKIRKRRKRRIRRRRSVEGIECEREGNGEEG